MFSEYKRKNKDIREYYYIKNDILVYYKKDGLGLKKSQFSNKRYDISKIEEVLKNKNVRKK